MVLIKAHLQSVIAELDLSKKVWLAYSGGVDSHVLLHAASALRTTLPSLQMTAVHVNHGLQKEADAWAKQCQSVCQQLQVPCVVQSVEVNQSGGESIEAEARKARYEALASLLSEGDYVLVAHHKEDQTETCLLQLFRGAGVKGMSAMPVMKPLDKGVLLRPLLNVSKQTILDYAKEHQLKWIQDPSNAIEMFSRNFLRHQVIPLLQTHYPALDKAVNRTARHMAEAAILLDEVAGEDFARVFDVTSEALNIASLKALSHARINNVLRYWIRQQKMILPSEKKLQHIISDVLHAAPSAQPKVSWGEAVMCRYAGLLYLKREQRSVMAEGVLEWRDLALPLILPSGDVLEMVGVERFDAVDPAVKPRDDISDVSFSLRDDRRERSVIPRLDRGIQAEAFRWSNERISIRFRQSGEKLRLNGQQKTLKKLFQTWRIPTWERSSVPLLYLNDQLVAVIPHAIDDRFRVEAGEAGWVVTVSEKITHSGPHRRKA
jgi:tRNA(Ile)-lysidine synthase